MAPQREISVSEFEASCLELLDEIEATKETLIVLRDGMPLVRVLPIEDPSSSDAHV